MQSPGPAERGSCATAIIPEKVHTHDQERRSKVFLWWWEDPNSTFQVLGQNNILKQAAALTNICIFSLLVLADAY